MASIPEVVISRLPLYVRALSQLWEQHTEVVSSRELGESLGVTSAQIRKDLSYFGRFGKQGRGYTVKYLLQELRQVLGLDRKWSTAVIGVGRLGRAIISYPGFAPQGFKILAAFDADRRVVGKRVDHLIVQDMTEMEKSIKQNNISIAIVAVPATHAQDVIDRLIQCGIKAILNYAPIRAQLPSDVKIKDVDPLPSLQSLTFHLKNMPVGRSAS